MANSPANPKIPRSMEDITKDYAMAKGQLADSVYIIHVHSKESERLKGLLERLNAEASERNALDKAKEEEDKK